MWPEMWDGEEFCAAPISSLDISGMTFFGGGRRQIVGTRAETCEESHCSLCFCDFLRSRLLEQRHRLPLVRSNSSAMPVEFPDPKDRSGVSLVRCALEPCQG